MPLNTLAVVGGSASWYLARGSGAVALVILTASMALGIATSRRWAPVRLPRVATQDLHRNLSLLGVAFIAVHVFTVVVDGYAPIGWLAAVVPFTSPYRRIWLGLGAVAVDILIAVLATTALRGRLPRRWWRGVHLASYALWPISLVHALGTGSDVRSRWLGSTMLALVAVMLAAAAWRMAARRVTVRTRVWGGAVALALPVLIASWAVVGPLRPGWYHRKPPSTPAARLASSRTADPAAAVGSAATSSGRASGDEHDESTRRHDEGEREDHEHDDHEHDEVRVGDHDNDDD